MDLNRKDIKGEVTIGDEIRHCHEELDGDYVGFWSIAPIARIHFRLDERETREFIALYVFTLLSHGAVVIELSGDGVHCWRQTEEFGVSPEDVAKNLVERWATGNLPNDVDWSGVAFATPEYLSSDDNLIAWHEQAQKEQGL